MFFNGSQRFNNFVFLGPDKWPEGNLNTNGLAFVTSVKVNKNNFNHMYAGTDGGGLWKTIDGGDNWKCLTDNIAGAGQSFFVDENDFNIIYVSTALSAPAGTILRNKYWGPGAYKSVDAGKSWTRLGLFNENEKHLLRDIKPSLLNKNYIYAISLNGIFSFRESDKTTLRKEIHISKNGQLSEIHTNKEGKGRLYLAGVRIFASINTDFTDFTDLSHLVADTTKDFRVSVDFFNEQIYAFVYESGRNKLFVSNDDAKSWELLSTQPLSGVGYDLIIRTSPAGEIYAGGIYLNKEVDSTKQKFKRTGSIMHPDIRCIEFPDKNNSDFVIVGNDGGIYKSENAGKTWSNITGNMACLKAFSVEINENMPDIISCGTADCGTMIRHSDKKWYNVFGCDGGNTIIDDSDTSNVWIMCNRNILFSNNGGIQGSFRPSSYIGKLVYHDSPIVQDPFVSKIVYTGGWNVSKYDVHENIKIQSTYITDFNTKGTVGSVTAMAVSAKSEYIYFASAGMDDIKPHFSTLWRISGDFDGHYKNISKKFNFLEDKELKISDIEIHKQKPLSIWITINNFSQNNKVFHSQNGGITWANISFNLENIPVNCISFDTKNNNLYIGTDTGIFLLKNNSCEWELMEGFPKVIVSDLKINSKSNELYIATYGRGIWKLSL